MIMTIHVLLNQCYLLDRNLYTVSDMPDMYSRNYITKL